MADVASTAKAEARARAIFNEADRDGNGWLSKTEIKRLMHAVRCSHKHKLSTFGPASQTATQVSDTSFFPSADQPLNEDVKEAILGDMHYRDLWRKLDVNQDNQIELEELIGYMKIRQGQRNDNENNNSNNSEDQNGTNGRESVNQTVKPAAASAAHKAAVGHAGRQEVVWENPERFAAHNGHHGLGLHPHMDEHPGHGAALEVAHVGLGLHPHPDEVAFFATQARRKTHGTNGSRVHAALHSDPAVLVDESGFTSGQDASPPGGSPAAMTKTKAMHLPAFGTKGTRHPHERDAGPHVRSDDETPPRDISPSAAEQHDRVSRQMRYVDAPLESTSETVRAGRATREASEFCEDVGTTWARGGSSDDDAAFTATFTTSTAVSANSASASVHRRVTFDSYGPLARAASTDDDLYRYRGRRTERKEHQPRTFMSRVVGLFAALLVLGTHFGIIAVSALFGAATGTIDRKSPTMSKEEKEMGEDELDELDEEEEELERQRTRRLRRRRGLPAGTSLRACFASAVNWAVDGVHDALTGVLASAQAHLLPTGLISTARRMTTVALGAAHRAVAFTRDCLCFGISLFIGTLLLIGAAATAVFTRVMTRRA